MFERAFAHAPQTLPSHASMFTGQLPFEHRVRDNLGFVLDAGSPDVGDALSRRRHIATAGFASAYVLRPETGIAQGFGVYDATLPPAAGDQAPAEILRDGPATVAAATKWLESIADDRFFVFLHIYEPHAPYTPPSTIRDGRSVRRRSGVLGRHHRQFLAALRRRGWYDDATIVVTADHGEGLGDHQEKEHGLFVYNETIRVPLIVKLPNSRRGGTRVAEPVQHIDLLPTLTGLAGIARARRPPRTRSRSRSVGPRHDHGRGDLRRGAVSPLPLRLERAHVAHRRAVQVHQGADPGALRSRARSARARNIAATRGQAATALRSGLEALIAGREPRAPSAVSAEDRERLAALGIHRHACAAAPAHAGQHAAGSERQGRHPGDLPRGGRSHQRSQVRRRMARLREVLADSPDMIDAWLTAAGDLHAHGPARGRVPGVS